MFWTQGLDAPSEVADAATCFCRPVAMCPRTRRRDKLFRFSSVQQPESADISRAWRRSLARIRFSSGIIRFVSFALLFNVGATITRWSPSTSSCLRPKSIVRLFEPSSGFTHRLFRIWWDAIMPQLRIPERQLWSAPGTLTWTGSWPAQQCMECRPPFSPLAFVSRADAQAVSSINSPSTRLIQISSGESRES